MTAERLAELERQESSPDAMNSGCTDYACYCHAKVPELAAEIRRLQRHLGDWRRECLAWADLAERQSDQQAAAACRPAIDPASVYGTHV